LSRLFLFLFCLTANNNVRPQIKIVDHVGPPFSWRTANTLQPEVRNAQLMLGKLPEQTCSFLARTSLVHQRLVNVYLRPRGNSDRRELLRGYEHAQRCGDPRCDAYVPLSDYPHFLPAISTCETCKTRVAGCCRGN